MVQTRYSVFSLPSELLDTLTPRTLIAQPPPREPSPPPPKPSQGTGCSICLGAAFVDVDEQRAHFRTDWHRYNVKIRLAGRNPVTEAAFAELVGGTRLLAFPDQASLHASNISGLEDSLSGSASDDDESLDESDTVNALLGRINHASLSDYNEDSTFRAPLTAVTWFHSPPSTQIGVYRMLLPLGTPPSAYLQELKEMQAIVEGGRKWAMFMVAGGHFAGAVVRVGRVADEQDEVVQTRKRKPPKPKPETEVLRHKTFHRYTSKPGTPDIGML